MRCAFIKPGGERCRGTATGGATLCYSHDPARAEERRRNARRGGKAGGNGRPGPGSLEVAEIQRQIRAVIGGVLSGRVDRADGGTVFMGFNTLLRAVEVARRIKETEELEARIEELERAEAEAGGGVWHHR